MAVNKVLVTGAAGQLGSVVCELASARDLQVVATDVVVPVNYEAILALDVSDADACGACLGRSAYRPDFVLHCGAWTDVDGCENDPERADLPPTAAAPPIWRKPAAGSTRG